MNTGRRLFFQRTFSLATMGVVSSVTPAIAKMSPVEECLRDMLDIKHQVDLREATDPTYVIGKRFYHEFNGILTDKVLELYAKSMDLFPKDPTKEDVRAMFIAGRISPEDEKKSGIIHPGKVAYYDKNDPSILPVAIARHTLGVWKLPICPPRDTKGRWTKFVKRYAPVVPSR